MIIGFGYKKQIGKDTGYKIIKQLYPEYNVYRISFADGVKQELEDLFLHQFGMTKEVFDNPKTKELTRPLVQWYATEFRRNPVFGGYEDYWVDIAFKKIEEIRLNDPLAIFVITDVRFLNEILRIRDEGGFSINVKRNTGMENDNHSSENILDNYLDEFDFEIENNGTLEDYKNEIALVLNAMVLMYGEI